MEKTRLRYAEDPRTQATLAERFAQSGEGVGCYQCACSVCGKIFYAARPYASLCSERCNLTVVLAKRREARRTHSKHKCSRCGKSFAPKRRDAAYCSNACRQGAHRNRARLPRKAKGRTVTDNVPVNRLQVRYP